MVQIRKPRTPSSLISVCVMLCASQSNHLMTTTALKERWLVLHFRQETQGKGICGESQAGLRPGRGSGGRLQGKATLLSRTCLHQAVPWPPSLPTASVRISV